MVDMLFNMIRQKHKEWDQDQNDCQCESRTCA